MSTVHADSPECHQPSEGDRNSSQPKWPSQRITTNHATTPVQYSLKYSEQLPQLQPHDRQQKLVLDDVPLPPSNHVISFHNHPACLIPVAKLHPKLEKALSAWIWCQNSNAGTPTVGNWFFVDGLLTLLTNFTRQVGSNPDRDYAKFMLQIACMQRLEGFETPTIYHSLRVPPRFYYRLRIALHYHRNSPVQYLPQGNDGGRGEIGHLLSWEESEDDVTLCVQLCGGRQIRHRSNWPDACDPKSTLFSFPPIFKQEVTAYATSLPSYTTVELNTVKTASTDQHRHVRTGRVSKPSSRIFRGDPEKRSRHDRRS